MCVPLCNVCRQNNNEKTSASSHSLLTVTGSWPCDLLIRASKAVIMAWEKFSASSRLAKLRPYTWRLSRHWWKVGVAWLYFSPFRMAQFITTWNRHKDVTLLVPVAQFNGTPRKEASWTGHWEHFVFSIMLPVLECCSFNIQVTEVLFLLQIWESHHALAVHSLPIKRWKKKLACVTDLVKMAAPTSKFLKTFKRQFKKQHTILMNI